MTEYLSQAEYLTRFGEIETARITNTDGGETVDTDALAAALADATETLESYLTRRYDLPLSSIPGSLKRIVGDLAREHLHTDYPTEAVTARADRARADLKLIANGTIDLNVAGAPVSVEPSGGPIAVARESVFSDTALAGWGGVYG